MQCVRGDRTDAGPRTMWSTWLRVATAAAVCVGSGHGQPGVHGAPQCSATMECLHSAGCVECLTALQPYAAFSVSAPVGEIRERIFYQTLIGDPACTPATFALLNRTLTEGNSNETCAAIAGFHNDVQPGNCQIAEINCALDPDCQECLTQLFNTNNDGQTAELLKSAACRASRSHFEPLSHSCYPFPTCTHYKVLCGDIPECVRGLAALQAGDASAAANMSLTLATGAHELDRVVRNCVGPSALSCVFMTRRCEENAKCNSCLTNMDWGRDKSTILAGGITPACTHGMAMPATELYISVFGACSHTRYTMCEAQVAFCVLAQPRVCSQCLSGGADADSAVCETLLGARITPSCAGCPEAVRIINRIVWATSAVGGVSVVACLVTIAVLVGHGRDRVSMRDRIIVGLLCCNAVYSSANAVPILLLRTDEATCGDFALSFATIRTGRAWWFAGKYSLVCYEIFILGSSIWALTAGARAVRPRQEAALHCACVLGGLAAFAAFYLRCAEINGQGYNEATQTEAQGNEYVHVSTTDDFDDDFPGIAASKRFDAGRDAFDRLIQETLLIWDGLLGVAVLLWVGLRWTHTQMAAGWRRMVVAEAKEEAQDEWADTRRSGWRARRTLLEVQREVGVEIASPLEPFVVVFLVFSVPVRSWPSSAPRTVLAQFSPHAHPSSSATRVNTHCALPSEGFTCILTPHCSSYALVCVPECVGHRYVDPVLRRSEWLDLPRGVRRVVKWRHHLRDVRHVL
eukprot:m.304884 g.304884  ORF g.304884 m.304884 type:complete len:747 (-) comp27334_c0_seq2:1511-3751(-)